MVVTGAWLGVVVGAFFSGVALWLLLRNAAKVENLTEMLRNSEAVAAGFRTECKRIPELETKLGVHEQSIKDMTEANAGLREKNAQMSTILAEERKQNDNAHKRLTTEFKNLANEILEDKSKRFTEQNKSNLDGLLAPLREQIKDFGKKVTDTYDKESKDRVSLFNEINHLKTLNERISEDAINLTNALKGQSKTQGTWGEFVLERVLENSGLEKGREYETQVNITAQSGKRYIPDVLLHLPNNKTIVIDAKVSLTAYERYCTADSDDEKAAALAQHIASVRGHVKELSGKDYQKLPGITTLDFVLMFVPVEQAFILATQQDSRLYDHAMRKNVLMVSPTTLYVTLRTIENIWRNERQGQNAQVIAKKAGDLYDKFVGFVTDMEDVGKKITQTQHSYDSALNKLSSGRGNLVRRAEEIKILGASTSKSLPENLLARGDLSTSLLPSGNLVDDTI